jgi:hypothetical protein
MNLCRLTPPIKTDTGLRLTVTNGCQASSFPPAKGISRGFTRIKADQIRTGFRRGANAGSLFAFIVLSGSIRVIRG